MYILGQMCLHADAVGCTDECREKRNKIKGNYLLVDVDE